MAKTVINALLSELADGALQERFEHELAKVTDNCMDPNTSVKKKRKINIGITVTTDDLRQDVYLEFETKSTLAPRENVGSRILIGKDGDDIYAQELKSGQHGQMYFDPKDSALKDDKGKPVEEIEKEIAAEKQVADDDIIEEQPVVQTKIHSFKKQANS